MTTPLPMTTHSLFTHQGEGPGASARAMIRATGQDPDQFPNPIEMLTCIVGALMAERAFAIGPSFYAAGEIGSVTVVWVEGHRVVPRPGGPYEMLPSRLEIRLHRRGSDQVAHRLYAEVTPDAAGANTVAKGPFR